MKELSMEEKSKRYVKALDEAKAIHKAIRKDLKPVIEQIFPELKESEDERIRKALISVLKSDFEKDTTIHGISVGDIIARLEKQGEQKPVEWCSEDEQNLNACLGYIPDEFLKRWLKDIIHIKYDKPIDKVEPKFHEGDFIKHNKANLICKVISVNRGIYYVENIEPSGGIELFNAEQNFHLWTIQDAKDGDVLVCEGEWTCIFKTLVNDKTFGSYCFIDCTGWFCKTVSKTFKEVVVKAHNGEIHPASKEQRDLLFTKMKEAGYKWDAENKELKKIEQTIEIPFGAKDSELQEVTYYIPNGYHAEINGNAVVIKKGELINNTPSQDHWQDVRERAAIAVLPQCLKITQDVLWRGGSLTEDTIAKQAATNAVDYADALVEKLKGE